MLIVVLAIAEGVYPSKIWLLLQHVQLVRGGHFPPESGGQFPAESVVTLRRNQVVNISVFSSIRIKLIGYFVKLAYGNFEANLDKIETGTYNQELVKDDTNGIYDILEKFSVEKIFTCREINYLESTGYSVFKGLLYKFYI